MPAERFNAGELRVRAFLTEKDVANVDVGPVVRLTVGAAGAFLFAASTRGRRGALTLPLRWDHGPAGARPPVDVSPPAEITPPAGVPPVPRLRRAA